MRIAVAQLAGAPSAAWPATMEAVDGAVASAVRESADLVLLPECVWPTYNIGSVAEHFAARAGGLPSDAWFLSQLRKRAAELRIGICAGYIAEHERTLTNAAALIAPDGDLLGTYEKCFLWEFDNEFFRPGAAIEPIDTPWGRIGVLICADARLPEIAATLVARGAQLLLQPTAWVDVFGDGRLWNPQPDYLISERAREFNVPFASCSKWGSEAGVAFVGQSAIFDHHGAALARCGPRESRVIVADIAPSNSATVVTTPAERDRLLSLAPPTLPSTAPRELAICWDASEAIAEAAAVLALARDPATRVHEQPPRVTLGAAAPAGTTCTLADVRVTVLSAAELRSFAPARVAALGGTHVVVVFGGNLREALLRTRATENRLFVVGVERARAVVIDPRGQTAGELSANQAAGVVRFEPRSAANKEFAPGTNALLNRRPALYEL